MLIKFAILSGLFAGLSSAQAPLPNSSDVTQDTHDRVYAAKTSARSCKGIAVCIAAKSELAKALGKAESECGTQKLLNTDTIVCFSPSDIENVGEKIRDLRKLAIKQQWAACEAAGQNLNEDGNGCEPKK